MKYIVWDGYSFRDIRREGKRWWGEGGGKPLFSRVPFLPPGILQLHPIWMRLCALKQNRRTEFIKPTIFKNTIFAMECPPLFFIFYEINTLKIRNTCYLKVFGLTVISAQDNFSGPWENTWELLLLEQTLLNLILPN